MDEHERLTERFEQHRSHLRAVAYRMLGSVTEADDALQEAWLRIRRQDPASVENMQAWLTTIVGRICLNMLRSRRSRREELSGHVPDPVVSFDERLDPEHEALLADSVGLALLVVLDALSPDGLRPRPRGGASGGVILDAPRSQRFRPLPPPCSCTK